MFLCFHRTYLSICVCVCVYILPFGFSTALFSSLSMPVRFLCAHTHTHRVQMFFCRNRLLITLILMLVSFAEWNKYAKHVFYYNKMQQHMKKNNDEQNLNQSCWKQWMRVHKEDFHKTTETHVRHTTQTMEMVMEHLWV